MKTTRSRLTGTRDWQQCRIGLHEDGDALKVVSRGFRKRIAQPCRVGLAARGKLRRRRRIRIPVVVGADDVQREKQNVTDAPANVLAVRAVLRIFALTFERQRPAAEACMTSREYVA